MDLRISVQNIALAEEGIDREKVLSNIEAEVSKLANQLGVKPKPIKKPAPSGAQGEFELIEWLFKLAQDPKMAVIYAKGLIFAVNQILEVWQSKRKPDAEEQKEKSGKSKKGKTLVKISVFNKTIALPAATIAIQDFLKSLGEG